MVKRWLVILAVALVAAGFGLGCGDPTGKGINSGKDKPTPQGK